METKIKTIGLTLLFLLVLIGCGEEEFIGQPSTDGSAPGMISNVSAESIPGGAIITYTPPNDEDFSHVEAFYSPNEHTNRTSVSTKFIQKLTVDGFDNTDSKQVELYAVDKSGNKSDKVVVDFVPLTPPHITIFESLKVKNDFSGVLIDWENENDVKNIGITVLRHDEFGDFVPFDVVYDDNTNETFQNVRGMDTLEVELGFFVRDRWGNVSDTLRGNFKPLYEILVDHNNITALKLDTDAIEDRPSSRPVSRVVDGKLAKEVQSRFSNYMSTRNTDINYFPLHITFDLSTETLFSRFIYHPTWWDAYKLGGVRRFELYGTSDEALIDRERNGTYVWPDGDDPNVTGNWREEGMDGWYKIGEFETTKPSGLEGNAYTTSGAGNDLSWVRDLTGFKYNMPPGTPSFRYIRFRATELWESALKYVAISEIQFFGSPLE